LGLITIAGELTADGERGSTLPLHPRLAHMIVRAQASGVAAAACDIAALLAEHDIIRPESLPGDPDIRIRLELLDAARRHGGAAAPVGYSVERPALQRVMRESDRLARAVAAWSVRSDQSPSVAESGSLLALAYPDRVGIARLGRTGRYLLRAGNEVAIDPASPLASEAFVVVAELDGKHPVSRVFLAAPIDRDAVRRSGGRHPRRRVERS
jgi:ATP-dependent helicase HrpB